MDRLKLTIRRINSICDFELSWSGGRTLTVQLEYPRSLANSYRQWRAAYLAYYGHPKFNNVQIRLWLLLLEMDCLAAILFLRESLRIVVKSFPLDCPKAPITLEESNRLLRDCHYRLIDEFETWLLHPRLAGIRRQIISVFSETKTPINLLVACSDSQRELTRLPWESWDIGAEIGASGEIRILRTTINNTSDIISYSQRKTTRILAIVGSDPFLDFSQDKAAIESLSSLADITFVELETNEIISDFVQRVFKSIEDSKGWDILFFIGHSNEGDYGGEFALTPRIILKMQELKRTLTEVVEKGLQLAIFNSCSGTDIAEYLIKLGLGQVVVMREPVHNSVARSFVGSLIGNLAQHKNIQQSLADSRQFLALESTKQRYPSAYLIASLYQHPDSQLFQFKNWKQSIYDWLPQKQYQKILFITLLLSLFPPIQGLLLEGRLLAQYLYRQTTGQVTATQQDKTAANSTLIIQVDEESLTKADLPWGAREDMDREYLADLVNKLTEHNKDSQVIGIDYKLWEPKPCEDRKSEQCEDEDSKLREAIFNARNNNKEFVFAGRNRQGKSNPEKKITPTISNPEVSLNGDIYFYTSYLELLTDRRNPNKPPKMPPFAYLLALASTEQKAQLVSENIEAETNTKINYLKQLRLNKFATLNEDFLVIPMWFRPILDYSLEPETIYDSVPAWCLTPKHNNNNPDCSAIADLSSRIVIIAPGGYEEADDNFYTPISLQITGQMPGDHLTGGEIHAYNLHHILNRHIITHIPDLLIVLLFAVLAQGIILNLSANNQTKWRQILVLSNLVYLFSSLQLYITLNLLLPIFLPSVLLWTYVHCFDTAKSR